MVDLCSMLQLQLTPFPELRTTRLHLRELNRNDVQALFEMRKDEALMEHIGKRRASTLQDAADLLERTINDRKENNGLTWALTLKDQDEMIGTIGYYRLQKEHYRGEVGYMLMQEHWGKGLMTEALEAVVQFGFNGMGFHSIEAVTDPANERSNRLLQRAGFVREGLFKQNYYFDGRFYDSAVYSKLRPGN